jgi:hypothetical protein
MNLKWIGIALVAFIGPAQPQTEKAQPQTEKTSGPKFEVTSVKPNKSPEPGTGSCSFFPVEGSLQQTSRLSR